MLSTIASSRGSRNQLFSVTTRIPAWPFIRMFFETFIKNRWNCFEIIYAWFLFFSSFLIFQMRFIALSLHFHLYVAHIITSGDDQRIASDYWLVMEYCCPLKQICWQETALTISAMWSICNDIFTGPRCLWGPVYGSRCLYVTHYIRHFFETLLMWLWPMVTIPAQWYLMVIVKIVGEVMVVI